MTPGTSAVGADDLDLLTAEGVPATTAALLGLAARWMDTMQDAIDTLAGGYVGARSGSEIARGTEGTEVQDALRLAASALRAMPNNDAAIRAWMKENAS